MRGRDTLSARKLALAEQTLHRTFPELPPRCNLAPSQDVPIIRETLDGQYEPARAPKAGQVTGPTLSRHDFQPQQSRCDLSGST